MASSFMTPDELVSRGLLAVDLTAQISRHATFYGAERITVGAYSRIDDFCVLSAGAGGITIGRHVHVSVMASMQGAGAITVGDFATISSRVALYSSSDDYSGGAMTNPTIPRAFRDVDDRPVEVAPHAIIGAASIILPGVVIGTGAGVAAMSLVKHTCEPFSMNAGVPARRIGDRSRGTVEARARWTRETAVQVMPDTT